MKAIFLGAALTALFLLAGCAEFFPNRIYIPYRAAPQDPYERSDIDELLRFGADFANSPSATRADRCRQLLKREQDASDVGVQLHLMIGRVLSESCGDIPKLLKALDAIPPERLADTRVRSLVAFNTAALKRLYTVPSGKRVVVEDRRPKVARPTTEVKNDDARILREKLEALRAIERKMDESGADN
jgi:hypothetical protein